MTTTENPTLQGESASTTENAVGVTVTLQFGDDFDRARIEHVAAQAVPMFVGMPGVRYKIFTLDGAARTATNFYVWESRAAAEEFFSDELRAMVIELYGAEPAIAYVEIVAIVDNHSH